MDRKRIIVVSIIVLIFIVCVVLSIIYYNGKYKIYFETGTSDVFLTQYVKKNGKVKEPSEPIKDGYIFKEWQLNGEKYDFDTEVKSNTILTAKWIKEEYVTIKFNTYIDEDIEPIKLLKGEKVEDLPNISKDNFIGWYLDDKLYNKEEIYDDITLDAHYELIENETEYKIGDNIKIIGNYSDSAYSLTDEYSVAIGWEREILDIINDSEFNYVVGNEYGVTGFFKASSIEKVRED